MEWGLELMIQNCFRGKNQAVNSSAGSSIHPLLSHQSSMTLLNPKSRINRARRVFSLTPSDSQQALLCYEKLKDVAAIMCSKSGIAEKKAWKNNLASS